MITIKPLLAKILTYIKGIDTRLTTAETAITAQTPAVVKVFAATQNIAHNTPTTVASVTLNKGVYLFHGIGKFASSNAGFRELRFSLTDGGSAASRNSSCISPPITGGVSLMQVTWPYEVTADGTTIYLVAVQTSNGNLDCIYPGITYIKLKG